MAQKSQRKDVATPSAENIAGAKAWRMVEDIRGGTERMREQAGEYLPKEPAEELPSYQNRIKRSVFTNYYVQIVDKLIGRPLKDPVQVAETVPENIREMLSNVDLQGSNLDTFARKIFQQAMDDGVTFVLTDFPKVFQTIPGDFPDGSLTIEQERALNVRPYAIHIKAIDLLGWKYEDRNGQKVLTQIRWKECVSVADPTSEFHEVKIDQIRVYEPGRSRIYRKDPEKKGQADEWQLYADYRTTIATIPLTIFYTNRIAFMCGRSPVIDVAFLNVKHFQSDSDQSEITHVARVPILFGEGWEGSESELIVGAGSFTKAPKGAKLSFVEHNGKGIEAGKLELDSLVERMEELGTRLIIRKPNATATGEIVTQGEELSDLEQMARGLEHALETMLNHFGLWLGLGEKIADEGAVTVFKDFGVVPGASQDLEWLLKAQGAGNFSRETIWKEAKRRGVLTDGFSEEEETSRLEDEAADMLQKTEEMAAATAIGAAAGEPPDDDEDEEAA